MFNLMKIHTNNAAFLVTLLFFCILPSSECFLTSTTKTSIPKNVLKSYSNNESTTATDNNNRREFLSKACTATATITSSSMINPNKAHAGNFAPGGTLVDYEVGIQVNNAEASPSRKLDNSNVIFPQDYYFKFGTAAQWIEAGSTEFPKTMPFVLSQQRYDALKKYGAKITSSCDFLQTDVKNAITDNNLSAIPDPATSASYSLRAFGLLANNFLASENTGTTNELILARYFINEIYLHVNDIRLAKDSKSASVYYDQLKKAMNSYLTLMNRVITSKVGDKFPYI